MIMPERILPPALVRLLDEMEEFGRTQDDAQPEHSKKMLNLEPATARLLHFILRSARRRKILEVGTSNGYSTIWIASAVAPAGEVISIDRSADKHALARANLEKAGLAHSVRLVTGEAAKTIPNLAGPFDAVFFDADRINAGAELQLLLPKLAPDVIVAADNVSSHPREIAGYLQAIHALPDFWEFTVPVGKGLSIAYRPKSEDKL
jgi:predicted O-methyltransferase YrrM